jgi:MATE family multidrug resistance protein
MPYTNPPCPSIGLWIGLTAALTFTGISSTYIVWRMDWEAESERTRIRLATSKHNDDDEDEEDDE